MGLLDPFTNSKLKLMPPGTEGPNPITGLDARDPTGSEREIAAIRTRGNTILNNNDVPMAPQAPQERALKTAASDMDFGIGDPGFPAGKRPMSLDMNFGMGDTGFGGGKQQARVAPYVDMPAGPPPTPSTGMLAAPLPPTRPGSFGPPAPLPPTRPVVIGQTASPPPIRPPGLGGGGATAMAPRTAPMPPVRPPGEMASTLPQTAPLPPVRPVDVADATGGMLDSDFIGGGPGFADAFGALGKIAGAFGGSKDKEPDAKAKAPTLDPSRMGAETSQQIAQSGMQAPQILQGLLVDPRRRRLA